MAKMQLFPVAAPRHVPVHPACAPIVRKKAQRESLTKRHAFCISTCQEPCIATLPGFELAPFGLISPAGFLAIAPHRRGEGSFCE
jgi:hypothetical protein